MQAEGSPGSRKALSQVAGIYGERRPAKALRSHVHRFWTNRLDSPAQLDVVPDGCIDIYCTGAELRVAGPNTRIAKVDVAGAASLVGVRFRPGVAGDWLRVPASALVNAHPLLEDVWDRRSTMRLADRISHAGAPMAAVAVIEDELLARLDGVKAPDGLARYGVAAALRNLPPAGGIVRLLSSELGCSERTLRRRSHEAFGYGVKMLERILRFQHFLALIGKSSGATLAALALEAGYADQAHLAREARRLSGYTPGGLLAELTQ